VTGEIREIVKVSSSKIPTFFRCIAGCEFPLDFSHVHLTKERESVRPRRHKVN